MHDSKLLSLFRTLAPDEKRRFKKWLASPYFNANRALSTFYEFLETRKDWTLTTLKKERAFAFVFENEPFDDLKMRRTMSEFLGQLEAFLAHESSLKKPVSAPLALADALAERQFSRSARRQTDRAAAQLEAQPRRNAAFFLENYQLESARFQHETSGDRGSKSAGPFVHFGAMNAALAAFFAAETLKNACAALASQAVRNEKWEVPMLDSVVAECERGRFDGTAAVEIFWRLWRCATGVSDAQLLDYQRVRAMLPDAEAFLSASELRGVFLLAINFCIRKINAGDAVFVREVFELYRLGLEKSALFEGRFLSRFAFKNIVAAALKLGETTWAESFINEFSEKIDPASRDVYRRFGLAKLRYAQKNWAEATDLLQNLAPDDVFLDLDARVLLLKIYFENHEWRLLAAFLETFRRFVSRKKMLANHAPNYLNLIALTEKMAERAGLFSPDDRPFFQLEIERTQPLTEREWLLTMAAN